MIRRLLDWLRGHRGERYGETTQPDPTDWFEHLEHEPTVEI